LKLIFIFSNLETAPVFFENLLFNPVSNLSGIWINNSWNCYGNFVNFLFFQFLNFFGIWVTNFEHCYSIYMNLLYFSFCKWNNVKSYITSKSPILYLVIFGKRYQKSVISFLIVIAVKLIDCLCLGDGKIVYCLYRKPGLWL
jgi:hypothetical protein